MDSDFTLRVRSAAPPTICSPTGASRHRKLVNAQRNFRRGSYASAPHRGDRRLLDAVERVIRTVVEHIENAAFELLWRRAWRPSRIAKKKETKKKKKTSNSRTRPLWSLVKTDRERAGTVATSALRVVELAEDAPHAVPSVQLASAGTNCSATRLDIRPASSADRRVKQAPRTRSSRANYASWVAPGRRASWPPGRSCASRVRSSQARRGRQSLAADLA